MNGQSSGHSSQPPVHNSQHALSIRTNTPTSTPRGPPSSSPSQPHSTYPIPIPKDKLSKAIELFARYRYAKGLDQRSQDNEPSHVDTLLNPGAAQSVTSRSSRVYTPSVSTSAYDGLTDISSLVSFTGEESILSGKGNGSTELIAYNGKRVKQRVRKRLSPMAKAKAALIRHLGSCPTCHSRRVPCPMEHHDVKALEKGLSSKSRKQREQASQEQSRSSVSASSNHAAESGPVPVNSSGVSLVQSNTLFGLGQNPQLLETISTSASDPQSLAADPLAGIQAQGHTPLLPNSVEFSRLFGANPYESYQDGQILALGVLRQYYICQHLDGLCDQNFESPEALEEHFESAHFTFARLEPPYRYICSNCQYWNTSLNSRCQQCRANRAIEVWIYGNFIRTPYYPRYPPDGHDPFKIEISSLHELSSMYDTPATDSQFGGGPGGIAGFTGGVNQGGYTYNYQNHNIYHAPNSPSHGFGAYGPSPSGESQNHHSGITEDQSEAESKLLSISSWYSKARNYQRRYKPVLIVILLLISMAAVLDLCDWLILKIEGLQPRLYLPAIGFVAVLASFIVGYALCSAYALYSANHRESHGVQCRPRRCPLHDFHPLSLDCRTIGSPIHVSINGG